MAHDPLPPRGTCLADLVDHIPCPSDVLEFAQFDPVVKHCAEMWKAGKLSWEQAMTACVVILAGDKQRLLKISSSNANPPYFYFPNRPNSEAVEKARELLGKMRITDSLVAGPSVYIDRSSMTEEQKQPKARGVEVYLEHLDRIVGKLPVVGKLTGSRRFACEQCGRVTDVHDGDVIECNYCMSKRLHLFTQMPADEPVIVQEKPV